MVRREMTCPRALPSAVLRWRPWGEKLHEEAMIFSQEAEMCGDPRGPGSQCIFLTSTLLSRAAPNLTQVWREFLLAYSRDFSTSSSAMDRLGFQGHTVPCLALWPFVSMRPPLQAVVCVDLSHPGTPSSPMLFLIHDFCGKHLVPQDRSVSCLPPDKI